MYILKIKRQLRACAQSLFIFVGFILLILAGCKIEITVPPGGSVVTESGSIICQPGPACLIEVIDETFDETFNAVADEGYLFAGWRREDGYLCAGRQLPCRLFTTFFSGSQALMDLLQQDKTYQLEPVFAPMLIYDFSSLDTSLEEFVQESRFDGASVIIVDKNLGVVYQRAFGSFDLDTVVQIRSASKVASASLLMAMVRSKLLDFDITNPIADYLPYEGYYGDRTPEQLLSNTSGIPGNAFNADYGPHLCQYFGQGTLKVCGKEIYQHLLANVYPAGTAYSYGGSQWHLAGVTAEYAGGASWNELFQRFIARPCKLGIFEYGNMLTQKRHELWNGDPASLIGKENPSIEAGAISNLQDYGKLLLLHLRDGWCGQNRVLAEGAAGFMRIDRKQPTIPPEYDSGYGYGMGWWIRTMGDADQITIHYVPGGLGTHAWIDESLGYGVVLLVEAAALNEDLSEVYTLVGGLFEQVREIMEQGRE